MRRDLAARAEIVGGADQTPAEVIPPQAVDQDARRQRVLGPNQPACEGSAVRPALLGLTEHLREAGLNACPLAVRVAPLEDVRWRDGGRVLYRPGLRQRRERLRFQCVDAGAQLGAALSIGG